MKTKTCKVPQTHTNGYRSQHRTRGCMVDELDMDKVTELARQIMALQHGTTVEDLIDSNWKADGPLAIARDYSSDQFTEGRQYAIVCTEGVGWSCQDDGLIEVPMRAGWAVTTSVGISPGVLLGMRTGEQVDLADYIRGFGDRLEGNFSIWFRAFTKGE